MIKIGSDFSGVGSFNQALIRLGIEYDEVFACDMDKYARQTFELNFGKPKYYPENVYDREIPAESLDIYVTSPPCQSFSLAGKRLGKEDKRGILFFNSLEFIQINKPRYFIFENVKGLLSHDKVEKSAEYGRTFQEWINYLGGKSVNGVHTFFPIEDSVPYHIYFQVMNAKHYGVPQNRERIFIIGIRDDSDNNFQFPKPFPLEKRLKDVLESEVDEKYFLSESNINALVKYNERQIENDRGFSAKFRNPEEVETMDALKVGGGGKDDLVKIGTWRTHQDGKGFREVEDGNCPTIPARAREDGSGQPVIKIGAIRGRNPQNPKSRESGLETEQMLEINENGTSNALTTVQKDNVVILPAEVYQLNPSLESGGKQPYQQNRVYDTRGVMTTLDTDSGKKSVLVPTNNSKGFDIAEEEEDSINFSVPSSKTRRGRVGHKISQTLDTACNQGIMTQQRIRRLTPTEAFRLMDFNEDFKWNVSDSQAYKQAGNSIVVSCFVELLKKLNL